jgi:hypothetical protein
MRVEQKPSWKFRCHCELNVPYKSIAFWWFQLVWCWDEWDRSISLEFTPTGFKVFDFVFYRYGG